jgi:RNA polymerase sigma-70 factor (ECF subfamily)
MGVSAVGRQPGEVAYSFRDTQEAPTGVRPLDLAAAAPLVHRYVARRVRDANDASDIAQQTLLLACAKGDTCQARNTSGWLFAIARNLVIDHYRSRGRFRFLEASKVEQTELALRTRPDAVHASYQHRQRLSCWLECISHRLSLEQQLAVLLSDVYGHLDRDSAACLGLSLPSFKLVLHRARGRLNAVAGGRCALGSARTNAPARAARAETVAVRVVLAGRSRLSALLALRTRLLRGIDQ